MHATSCVEAGIDACQDASLATVVLAARLQEAKLTLFG